MESSAVGGFFIFTNRAEEVALTRLCTYRLQLSHSRLSLINTDAPVCMHCNIQLTVKHVLPQTAANNLGD